jgi:hypothetical protein
MISVSPTTVGKVQSVTLSVKTPLTGGASPYTCQWLAESPKATSFTALGTSFTAGCTTSSKPSVSTGALMTLGVWTFELQVKDAAGITVTSSPVKLTVTKASTVTTISCEKSSIAKGKTTTCTATVSGYSPTGTVTWSKVSGTGKVTFSKTTCTMSKKGSCSVTVIGTAAGSVTIEATYSGDSNNLKSSATQALKIT